MASDRTPCLVPPSVGWLIPVRPSSARPSRVLPLVPSFSCFQTSNRGLEWWAEITSKSCGVDRRDHHLDFTNWKADTQDSSLKTRSNLNDNPSLGSFNSFSTHNRSSNKANRITHKSHPCFLWLWDGCKLRYLRLNRKVSWSICFCVWNVLNYKTHFSKCIWEVEKGWEVGLVRDASVTSQNISPYN